MPYIGHRRAQIVEEILQISRSFLPASLHQLVRLSVSRKIDGFEYRRSTGYPVPFHCTASEEEPMFNNAYRSAAMRAIVSRRTFRRSATTMLALLGVFGTSLAANPTQAFAATSAARSTITTLNPERSAALKAVGTFVHPSVQQAAQFRALYKPMSSFEVQRATSTLPKPSSVAEHTYRTVIRLANNIYASQLSINRDGSERAAAWKLSALGKDPTLVAAAAATVGSRNYRVRVTRSNRPGFFETSGGRLDRTAANCNVCVLAGAEGGTVVDAACVIAGAGVAEELTVLCLGLAAIMGIDTGLVCAAQHCTATGHGGMAALLDDCQFGECTITAGVRNPDGTTLTSLGSDILWIYAPGTYAQLPGGGYASEVDDTASAGGSATTEENVHIYTWNHYASKLPWANCSAYVEFSVTAAWSNSQFVSTGFSEPKPKPAETTCPGFHD